MEHGKLDAYMDIWILNTQNCVYPTTKLKPKQKPNHFKSQKIKIN